MKNNFLFTYGILQRGYKLDLTNYGAKFLGEAHIEGAVLYGIGGYWQGDGYVNDAVWKYHGVGLKLDKDPERVAHGELWEIPPSLWDWLDSIEQNGRVYTRKIVVVQADVQDPWSEQIVYEPVDAWVYEHNFENFPKEHIIKGGQF
jgi:gamma-glutamylcyclotransferase (GGCT)/AIG2-like uncharacterized protein YtfP